MAVRGLTISQVASYVDVTVKAVRHYHRLGLVDEPERDSSGYRRYGAAELLRLVQIRALADAGVPLAQVAAMIEAGPDRFAQAVAEVKQRLTTQITELTARRDLLERLSADDRVSLPDRAWAIVDRAAELGFPADYLATAQENFILAKTLICGDFDDFLRYVEVSLDDARYVELLKQSWAAGEWDPDDPRVDALAAACSRHLLANPELLAIPTSLQGAADSQARHEVIHEYQARSAPARARLSKLIEADLHVAGVDTGRRLPSAPC